MLAMLTLAQASLALAACAMERGELAQVLTAADAQHDCCPDAACDTVPMTANACVALSTADLQVAGEPAAIFLAIADGPVLLLPRDIARSVVPASRPVRRDHVPPRILLHSFLI